MMAQSISYAFHEDGRVAAFLGDHLITAGEDFEKVAMTADEYFNSLRKEQQKKAAEEARKTATHIATPQGLKGEILGRTAGLWADEITVRFENNEIRRYATFVGDGLKYSKEEPNLPSSPMEYFQNKLDRTYVSSQTGLTDRLAELDTVRKGAANLASQTPYQDAQALHQIVLTANAERQEVQEALDHLAMQETEAMTPPQKSYSSVEQASVGRSDSWLDILAKEVIAESENQDFDKLMAEGPTLFVSNLDVGTLAHAGTVREMALEHVHAKTAGFKGEAVNDYRDQFVARAEMARRQELSYRKDAAAKQAQKTASVSDNAPDEALFM